MFAKSTEVTRLLLLICIVFESCLSSPFQSELSEGITHSEDEPQEPKIPEELPEKTKLYFIPMYKFSEPYHRFEWEHKDLKFDEYKDEYEDTILKSKATSLPSVSEDQSQSSEIPEDKFSFDKWQHENLIPESDEYQETTLKSKEKLEDEYQEMYKILVENQKDFQEITLKPEENSSSVSEEDSFNSKDPEVSPVDVEHATQDATEWHVTTSKNKLKYTEFLRFDCKQSLRDMFIFDLFTDFTNFIKYLKDEYEKKLELSTLYELCMD